MMKRTKNKLWLRASLSLLLGVTLLGGIQACSLVPPVGITPTIRDRGVGPCETNADCLEGQVCLNTLHYCRTMGNDSSQQLSLQLLVPPSKDGLTTTITKQQFINVDLANIQNKIIQPRQAYEVKGTVWAWETNSSGQKIKINIAAKIRFLDKNFINGQPLVWEVSSLSQSGQFTAQLSFGTYDVDVFPIDNKYPTFRFENFKVLQDRTKNLTSQFELPSRATCSKLIGRIVSATLSQPQSPLEGLEIQVLTSSGWSMSTIAKTDSEGRFELWLTKGKEPSTIRLRMTSSTQLHPEVDLPYAILTDGKPQNKNTTDLGTLPIGFKNQPITIKGTIRTGQGGDLIANSRLRLLGTIDFGTYKTHGLKGLYRAETTSDANGHYELRVPPGNYQLEVLPPTSSPWAKAIIQTQSLTEDKNIDVDLVEKYRVEGKICKAGLLGNCEEKIEKTQIRAVWQGAPNTSQTINELYKPLSSSSYQTKQADADGTYRLKLDPGIYNLIFIPPPDSGLARTFIKTCIHDKRVQVNAFLPPAKYLGGQTINSKGFPIEGITVEVYEYTTSTQGEARLLGRGITNSQGKFSIPYSPPSPTENPKCK